MPQFPAGRVVLPSSASDGVDALHSNCPPCLPAAWCPGPRLRPSMASCPSAAPPAPCGHPATPHFLTAPLSPTPSLDPDHPFPTCQSPVPHSGPPKPLPPCSLGQSPLRGQIVPHSLSVLFVQRLYAPQAMGLPRPPLGSRFALGLSVFLRRLP